MQTFDYIFDEQGNFRFTRTGLENQSALFTMAGIDANAIKTYDDYLNARRAASPFFLEYLEWDTEERLKNTPDSLEKQAILSIVFGTEAEQDRPIKKLATKSKLTTL